MTKPYDGLVCEHCEQPMGQIQVIDEQRKQIMACCAEMEAEVQRLRDALETIAAWEWGERVWPDAEVAREALRTAEGFFSRDDDDMREDDGWDAEGMRQR